METYIFHLAYYVRFYIIEFSVTWFLISCIAIHLVDTPFFFALDWRKVWISNIFNWNTGKGPGVVQKSDSEWKMNIPYFPSPYSLRVATINNLGFPGGASGKEPTCQCRRLKRHGSIPGSGRSPGEGNGNLLQYSCLENPMDFRGAQWATAHGVAELDMTETN